MSTFNPDYTKRTDYTSDYPFSEIIFPEDVPLCAQDINEIQQNIGFQIGTIAKNVFDTSSKNSAGISYVPFSRDVKVEYLEDEEVFVHNFSINGLVITDNHVFKINTTKSLNVSAKAIDTVSLIMTPTIAVVDETTANIKILGADTVLPNYISNNDFMEGITRREALTVSFSLIVNSEPPETSIEIYRAVGDNIISPEIVTPAMQFDDFKEYAAIYNQPYLLSDMDRQMLNGQREAMAALSSGDWFFLNTFRLFWRGRVFSISQASINFDQDVYQKTTYLVAKEDPGTGKVSFGVVGVMNEWNRAHMTEEYSGMTPLICLYRNSYGGGFLPDEFPCANNVFAFLGRNTTKNLPVFNEEASSRAKAILASKISSGIVYVDEESHNAASSRPTPPGFGEVVIQRKRNAANGTANRDCEALMMSTLIDSDKPVYENIIITRGESFYFRAGDVIVGIGYEGSDLKLDSNYDQHFLLRGTVEDGTVGYPVYEVTSLPYTISEDADGAWVKDWIIENDTRTDPSFDYIYVKRRNLLNIISLGVDSSGNAFTRTGYVDFSDDFHHGVKYDDPKYLSFASEDILVGNTIVSFASDNWVLDENGMYTQSVTVEGLKESDVMFSDVKLSSDATVWEAQVEAYLLVTKIISSDNKVTAYCTKEAPAVSFSVQLTAIRSNTNYLN